MNHSRIDTTQVYLRALNRSKAMEAVRDPSWDFGFQPQDEEAHTGFGHPCKWPPSVREHPDCDACCLAQ